MTRTPTPRWRGGESLASDRAANGADRGQMRRLLAARQEVPPPLTSGFLGTAQFRSVDGSVVHDGNSQIEFNDVAYGAPTDPFAGTGGEGLAPSGWASSSGPYITLAEGFYTATPFADIAWGTPSRAPDWIRTLISGIPDEVQEVVYHACVTDTRRGIRQPLPCGPFYAAFDLSFDATFATHTGGGDTLLSLSQGGGALASITWTIVKHS